ncbi:iron-siderophore ABC transporter substrate-binding protein [Streptomyces laculatispora]|uniref:Iron-siderophore ABC transporter substrate-binding protein n=1 Tax=Streptomyces laculatispora TaxID=887464 RepID=A0ABY9I3Z2_9ACTN|nr:iron-siderophore ABC transporter substrate-binding protein [Streptomyces laculatispora]WLQ41567.1 iron-siderophore ABC transporter substrate-binding protein [Streptomyces laculatispora]
MATSVRRRRLTLGALALTGALALSACGSSGSGARSDGSSSAGTTHTMKTVMGDVKVPAHPKRVVVLDTGELDSALTLGVQPVGGTHSATEDGFPAYLPADRTKDIKEVGEIANPSMETVASLEPDLILTSKVRDGERYKQLSAIAPTVMTESTGSAWKENFQVHAEALGKQAEAKKVIASYDAHVAKVTAAIGGRKKAAATDVNFVRFVEGADIRIYGKQNYIGSILADLGMGRPAITDKAKDGFSYDVSPEKIDLADADAVFTSTYGDPDKAGTTRTMRSGLWKGLKASKDGKVFKVDDRLWIAGIGYTAADRILDEFQTKMTG